MVKTVPMSSSVHILMPFVNLVNALVLMINLEMMAQKHVNQRRHMEMVAQPQRNVLHLDLNVMAPQRNVLVQLVIIILELNVCPVSF